MRFRGRARGSVTPRHLPIRDSRKPRLRVGSCCFLVLLLALSLCASATAAPWESLAGAGVRVLYPPGQGQTARRVVTDAESALQRISGEVAWDAPRPITLVLHATHRDFARATGTSRRHLVVGIASGRESVAHVDVSGLASDLSLLVAHEVAHLVLIQAVEDAPMPLWFHEGFAEHASGRLAGVAKEQLADRLANGGLFDLSLLEDTFPREGEAATIAYAQSHALVDYLLEHAPFGSLPELTRRLRAREPFDAALLSATGRTAGEWDEAWRHDFRRRFRWYPWIALGVGATGALMALLCLLAFRANRRRISLLPE